MIMIAPVSLAAQTFCSERVGLQSGVDVSEYQLQDLFYSMINEE